MSIDVDHLRLHVIRPIITHLNMWSASAENLLLGTAAQESHMGTYLRQWDAGPARGIYQIEPDTHDDIWRNYLKFRKALKAKVTSMRAEWSTPIDQLMTNLAYTTAMARLVYRRVPTALPEENDIEGLAGYWKEHYNTSKGKGTEEEFVENYKRFISETVGYEASGADADYKDDYDVMLMVRPRSHIAKLVKLYGLGKDKVAMTFIDQKPPIVILPPFTRQKGRQQIVDHTLLLHELDHVEFGMETPTHPKEDDHEPT